MASDMFSFRGGGFMAISGHAVPTASLVATSLHYLFTSGIPLARST
jgi:hypothetical protein